MHSSDANFSVTCGLHGCATTSKSFSALYTHIYRRHPHIIKKRIERDELCEDLSTVRSRDPSTFDLEDNTLQGNLL